MFNRCFWTYTQLCFFTVAAFASSRFMKFSKRIGQRITSGATQIGHKRRPDMSTTMCASLCGDECGMFHFNTVTNECFIFMEKNYNAIVVTTPDPDWTVSFRTDHTTVRQGDWTLVFRAQSGVGEPTWESWNNTGVYNDNPVPKDFPHECLRLTNYSSCDRHFRSHILDNWDNVKEVRLSFTKDDSEVAYVLFNGTGTDRDSWFSQKRILDSTWWPVLANEQILTNPGIYGWLDPSLAVRRFYLAGPRNGCSDDWIYTMVIDGQFESCISTQVWHITLSTPPNLFYSPSPDGPAYLTTQTGIPLAKKADVLSVWVKFT